MQLKITLTQHSIINGIANQQLQIKKLPIETNRPHQDSTRSSNSKATGHSVPQGNGCEIVMLASVTQRCESFLEAPGIKRVWVENVLESF